jgi:hypothetical protein
MQLFQCPTCGNRLYFENSQCARCGAVVGFDLAANCFRLVGGSSAHIYCANAERGACYWVIAADSHGKFCLSCALNEVIPPVDDPVHHRRWVGVEAAKRRLVYGLWQLDLPVVPRAASEDGLAFRILVDSAHGGAGKVLMGHENGTITIDATEADPPERESRRVQLQEPFRTLLGHMRHESGHYYWDRLIRPTPFLAEFRALFSDEHADYAAALERHYAEGAPGNWPEQFISAYATMHPWEDWAETWAHYLHIADAVETASASGFWSSPVAPARTIDFETLYSRWQDAVLVMNSMNRSMGHADFYPFVVSAGARQKLSFVHRVVTMRAR